jgi:hypothetical protein
LQYASLMPGSRVGEKIITSSHSRQENNYLL